MRPAPAPWLIALALAAVTLLVFGQVATQAFISYDDGAYVTENPHVLGGLTRAGVFWAFRSVEYFYWQPLTWLSHMLDCEWFGLRAGWHHATSLVLHLASSLLLFFAFRRMTGALWRSALLAGLFALHPLRVESVSWIAERKDVLSGFFMVATLWAYARYAERPSNRRYGLVLLGLLLGLMSKPMLVTAPFLLLALDYWPLRRRALAEKFPMLILAGVSAVLTAVGQHRMGAMPADIPFSLRAANALVSYTRYLGKTLWPQHLAIFYPFPASIPPWQIAGAAALLVGITAALWSMRRQRPYLLAGWAWFVVGLLPTIGLVQVGRQAMADRFTYIPLIGVFAALVWGAEELLRGTAAPRRLASAITVIVLLACALQSWRQTRTWRDNLTVFRHAIAVTPPNAVAEDNLALALEAGGDRDAALAHYAEAVRIETRYYFAWLHYGSALLERGETSSAVASFSEAVRLRPEIGKGRELLERALRGPGPPP